MSEPAESDVREYWDPWGLGWRYSVIVGPPGLVNFLTDEIEWDKHGASSRREVP